MYTSEDNIELTLPNTMMMNNIIALS